ncbi:hypothetical protein ACE14D_07805 [Streptomyces sp. Act-28]
MLAANLVIDLDIWLRLLVLHGNKDLVDTEPDTMRLCLYHIPAHLARHARRDPRRALTASTSHDQSGRSTTRKTLVEELAHKAS